MKTRITLIALGLLMIGAPIAQAQEGQARSLSELLRLVEQGRASEAQENRQREREFQADRANQQKILNDTKARKAAAERRSEQLENTFEANEVILAEKQDALEKRLGSLKELFGVLQQVAGDTQGFFDDSLTSIQYPDRGEFLTELGSKMGSATELASIEEIERLWFELQREATENGKVARFTTTVTNTDGTTAEETVVRVGAFNVVADGNYLEYNPATGNLLVLSRQPPQGRYVKSTSELVKAAQGSGPVAFAVDPTRGQILRSLISTPTLKERIDQGGTVGYLILALGALGLLLALERLISLSTASRKVTAQLKSSKAADNNPLGRVLKVAEENRGMDRESLELKLGEAILKETPALNRGVLFLKIIAVIAPLMGLLGTVTGMINTFQAITLYGTGDPKLMAGGISQALVTTVLGLVVAIPMVLLHTLVSGRSNRIVHVLQEQSAGIIAERDEQEGRGA